MSTSLGGGRFGDIKRDDRGDQVTVLAGDLFPDVLDLATLEYKPVMERFDELLGEASSATDLYRAVLNEPRARRAKLVATFRRYFTQVSTEVLGKVGRVDHVIRQFGDDFRPIEEVWERFRGRPFLDETLMAILYINAQRGKTGYTFTGLFFSWFETTFANQYRISGPRGSGTDLNLRKELQNYPKATKADFLVRDQEGSPLVVGFARYDAHRGGSQEDDRIKGNNDNLTDIMEYSTQQGRPLRTLFLNDGPGLVAGSMWNDYAELERRWEPNVIVSTLKMLDQRITTDWLDGK